MQVLKILKLSLVLNLTKKPNKRTHSFYYILDKEEKKKTCRSTGQVELKSPALIFTFHCIGSLILKKYPIRNVSCCPKS